MKKAEEILKSKLSIKLAIANNPDYTFNKIVEAMNEHATEAINEVIKKYYSGIYPRLLDEIAQEVINNLK